MHTTREKIDKQMRKLWNKADQKRAREEGYVLITNLHFLWPDLIGSFVIDDPFGSERPSLAQERIARLREESPDDPFYRRAVVASTYLRMTK